MRKTLLLLLFLINFSLFAQARHDRFAAGISINTLPEFGFFGKANWFYLNVSLGMGNVNEDSLENPYWYSTRVSMGYHHSFTNGIAIMGGMGLRYLSISNNEKSFGYTGDWYYDPIYDKYTQYYSINEYDTYFILFPELGISYSWNRLLLGVIYQLDLSKDHGTLPPQTDSSKYRRSSINFIIARVF